MYTYSCMLGIVELEFVLDTFLSVIRCNSMCFHRTCWMKAQKLSVSSPEQASS